MARKLEHLNCVAGRIKGGGGGVKQNLIQKKVLSVGYWLVWLFVFVPVYVSRFVVVGVEWERANESALERGS